MDEDQVKELKKTLTPGHGEALRQSSHGALMEKIRQKEKEVAALVTLESAINWKLLNDEQEENLWTYFVRAR